MMSSGGIQPPPSRYAFRSHLPPPVNGLAMQLEVTRDAPVMRLEVTRGLEMIRSLCSPKSAVAASGCIRCARRSHSIAIGPKSLDVRG